MRSRTNVTVFAVIGMMLLVLILSGSWVFADSLQQGELTPTPTVPPLGSLPVAEPGSLGILAVAANTENLEWENVTFWAQGILGDANLANLAITYEMGQEFPAFEVPVFGGGTFDLAHVEAQPFLLNFWASWCGPCRLEMPLLREAHNDAGSGFEIVLINVWDEEESYAAYVEEEIPTTLLSGRALDNELTDQLGIQAIPTSILVDANRQILAVHIGNLTPAVMDFLGGLAASSPVSAVAQVTPAPVEQGGPDELDELAQAVADGNRNAGGVTLWRGGALGDDDGFRLSVQVGDKLPAVGLETAEGDMFRLDMVSEPYLLNFWASWCGPCTAEFPLLIERDESAETPYRVAFVNVWDDPYTAAEFLANFPDDLLAMVDTNARFTDAYRIEFIPTTILVDADGIVQMIQFGMISAEVLDFADVLLASPSGS